MLVGLGSSDFQTPVQNFTDRHFSNESRSLESQYEELLKSARTSTWPPIDKVAQEILLSICKAELEEMNSHEHEQHQASDS